MTPATGDLHYLAAQQAKSNIKVIQPESELSVINMALGMSYAGKRVAVGSATGGFMLMQEAFSFSGIAELPLAVVVAQRQGPATGVPTYSSQTDLNMAIHAGHGEFPRIVLIPGDTDEAFEAGANALNLAWKYQIPAIVLMDKILCEHASTASLKAQDITIDQGLIAKNPASDYGRYEITKDGISPIVFPGTSNAVVKITSYEHDEHGVTTEEAEMMEKMIDKRFKKGETLQKELKHFETVKIYGDKDSDTAIIFWGSTKGPVLEAAKYLDKTVKLIQILWAEPFDSHRLKNELKGVKNIINIECNHNAQMAALIREKTGIEMNHNILKYDARPFDPIELVGEINTILK
jgi:2-oxoglutarate ferredoxin oxidoreductase subunit alpha